MSFYSQVYQTIAPISSFILGFSFLILRPFCLHQFVYIYPIMPDSGGVIWTEFIKILLVCMLIAEITIVGLMGLKKAAVATPLMIRKYWADGSCIFRCCFHTTDIIFHFHQMFRNTKHSLSSRSCSMDMFAKSISA